MDVRTQRGNVAIISAALEGNIECVRLLLEGGADKDATDYVRHFILSTILCACYVGVKAQDG